MRSKTKPRRSPLDCGDGSFAVPLTRGLVAYIDAEDAERVGAYEWHAVLTSGVDQQYKRVYAATTIGDELVKLHRFLLDAPAESIVDHLDLDTLNDRRSNLRFATNTENCMNRPPNRNNTSGYKGVVKYRGRWRAQLQAKGRPAHIGTFDTAKEAALAYDAKAREMFGEFAWQNFPEPHGDSYGKPVGGSRYSTGGVRRVR